MAKLKIIRAQFENGNITELSGPSNIFEATINPESYSRTYGLKYSSTSGAKSQPLNIGRPAPKYSTSDPEKLNFSIVLDGTGVVPDPLQQTVSEQFEKLRKVAYDYVGDKHEPAPVKIVWGAGLTEFFGRLVSLSVDYTLFHSDGTALRAKVKLAFIEASTPEKSAREANTSSPDLTHLVRVRQGDTLPLLCERIYKDPEKYLAIARINNLDGFRALVPDTLLRFPPME